MRGPGQKAVPGMRHGWRTHHRGKGTPAGTIRPLAQGLLALPVVCGWWQHPGAAVVGGSGASASHAHITSGGERRAPSVPRMGHQLKRGDASATAAGHTHCPG